MHANLFLQLSHFQRAPNSPKQEKFLSSSFSSSVMVLPPVLFVLLLFVSLSSYNLRIKAGILQDASRYKEAYSLVQVVCVASTHYLLDDRTEGFFYLCNHRKRIYFLNVYRFASLLLANIFYHKLFLIPFHLLNEYIFWLFHGFFLSWS